MANLVSRTELARLAGVAKPSITKAAVKQFPGACVGPRIDLDHPDVQRYLSGRARAPTNPASPPAKAESAPTEVRPSTNPPPASPPPRPAPAAKQETRRAPQADRAPALEAHEVTNEDIEAYAHMSLDALTRKFGTATAFTDWLDARKRISDIREKDLKNDERAGRLIPRELVRTHVFAHIEAANRRLLQDASTTIARRVYAAAKAGTAVEEAEQLVREIITSHLRPVKATATRVLRGEAEPAT